MAMTRTPEIGSFASSSTRPVMRLMCGSVKSTLSATLPVGEIKRLALLDTAGVGRNSVAGSRSASRLCCSGPPEGP